MKQFFTILALFAGFSLSAQTVIDFEDFDVPVDSFFNGKNANGSFTSENVIFPNNYFPDFDGWDGWAISTKTDSVTSGFTNQYSAKTAGGFDGSMTYGVTFGGERKVLFTERVELDGFYVTNSTYAYNSMRDGDQFAKRFGGETGDDPDFFRLTVYKYLDGQISTDSVDFYLADYRFEDNSQDYIVDTWAWVDLTALGQADSLLMRLASSDVGEFGINTPQYFCVDNFTVRGMTSSVGDFASNVNLRAFPNPATDWLQLEWTGTGEANVRLFDLNGKIWKARRVAPGRTKFDVSTLPQGMYFLQVQIENRIYNEKIIKQ